MYSFPSNSFRNNRYLLLSAGLFFACKSLPVGGADSHSHSEIHELDPFVVDASLSPRSSRDMLTPATVVASDELETSLAPTIGQLLEGQPGVHSSAFGAGASRPVIRGLEGNRLRVMVSGVDSGDLSADSPDHAAAVEPFFVDRVEVLRGASTLLYGSSAIGGVVNIIDKRIPRQHPGEGSSLEAMVDYQSVAEGWTRGALATVPVDNFVIPAGYLDREHGDYSIPGHPDHDEEHEGEEPSGVLENSFLQSRVGSLGLSWFPGDRTRVSLAWTTTDSLYGVPGHDHGEHEHEEPHEEEHHDEDDADHDEEHAESVAIDLSQSALDLEAEHRIQGSWIQSIEARVRLIRYEHQELEGDEIGTDFDRESIEARLVATYLAAEDAPGALGLQWAGLDSKVAGEEALTPDSETRDAALFLLQEWQMDNLRIEGGMRAEHRSIDAADRPGYSDWAMSGSLGARVQLRQNWSLGALFTHAGRHPNATELYADGPHAATRQFEIGDAALGVETANGMDLSLHFESELLSASLTAFHTRFSDFIFAAPTEEEREGFPVYRYGQVDADFRGFETELTWHAWHEGEAFFDVGLLMDWVDTDIRGTHEDLPRIPPLRVGASVHFGAERWLVRSSIQRSLKQDDVARFEEPSGAYTNWSAALVLDLPAHQGEWHLVLAGDNLLDEEIRPHTSPIKDVAPRPGRSLRVSLSVGY